MNSDIAIILCTDDDLDRLALMNKQLIEDEKHDNPMNADQLRVRMRDFIHTDYKAYKFVEQDAVVGYALVNHQQHPLYLRQFFISREYRRSGFGKLAFKKLLAALNTSAIDIEVMYWNEAGYAFWKSLGFEERSVYMRLDRATE